MQDCRGRGDSDGNFTPWADDFADGYDTVQWAASQPWCDGQVGMVGGAPLLVAGKIEDIAASILAQANAPE